MTKATVRSNVTQGLNIRNANDPSQILGKLYYNTLLKKGDVVYGEVKTDSRIYFNKVYRANGTIDQIAGSAAVRDATQEWLSLTEEAEPNPDPVPLPTVKPLIVTIGGEGYETVTVEVKPK